MTKNILLIVPHVPAFDSCMLLMIQLHYRGKVDVKIIINQRLIKIDSRIEQTLKVQGVPYMVKSLLQIKLFSWLQIARSDFISTQSDRIAYGGKFYHRDTLIKFWKKYCFYSAQRGAAGPPNKGNTARRLGLPFENSPNMGRFTKYSDRFSCPRWGRSIACYRISKTYLLETWPNQDRLAEERSQFWLQDGTLLGSHV